MYDGLWHLIELYELSKILGKCQTGREEEFGEELGFTLCSVGMDLAWELFHKENEGESGSLGWCYPRAVRTNFSFDLVNLVSNAKNHRSDNLACDPTSSTSLLFIFVHLYKWRDKSGPRRASCDQHRIFSCIGQLDAAYLYLKWPCKQTDQSDDNSGISGVLNYV